MKQVEFTGQAQLASIEWAVLERAYTLVGHLRQLRASSEQQEVQQVSNHIKYDIQGLQDMLRVAGEEAKAVAGMQPASRSTDLSETTAMDEESHKAAHKRTKKAKT
jgi:hypothetical protein